MTEPEFNADAAIEAAVSRQTTAEKERWKKFQNEERAKMRPINARAEMGRRMVELALRSLESQYSDFEFTRMAEGYSLMGDFEQAVKITKDPEKKAFYQRVLDATNIDCIHEKSFLYDRYPGITLYICPVCGHLRKC